MRFSFVKPMSVVVLLSAAVSSDASVLCAKKSGGLVMRAACKAKETAGDAATAGLQGPQGNEGQQGLQGPQGPGARWAVVAADGTIVAQTGGITVSFVSGLFKVSMGADVTNKTIQLSNVAIGADTGTRGPSTFALCGTAPTAIDCTSIGAANDNQTIVVATTSLAGANALHAFHIAVF